MIGEADAIRWTVVLLSAACLVSAVELFAARDVFADGQLLSWKVARYQSKWRLHTRAGAIIDRLLAERAYLWLMVLRAVTAAVMIACAIGGVVAWPMLVVLAATTIAVNVRSPFGLDGAFQMTVVIAVGLAMSTTAAGLLGVEGANRLVLVFVAAQLLLSYVVAGVAKVVSPGWRSGRALVGIMSTRMYGHDRVFRLLRVAPPRVNKGACWAVVAFECLMPLVLIAPARLVPVFLAVGIAFHVGTAVVMGLNDFLLSFIAAYPALAFVVAGAG